MLFGGKSNDKSFYSFSPSKQQWTMFPGLRRSRYNHGSVVIGDSVFLVGGDDNKSIEEYNISTKTFKIVAIMKKPRSCFGVCVINKSEVLVAGGKDDKYNETNNCFLFNTNSKTFKDIADMNTKRSRHVLVNLKEVVYSIGGWDDKGK